MDGMTRSAPHVTIGDVDARGTHLTDEVLDDETADCLARVFKALGEPTRVKLLSLIAAGDDGEACVCDLTDVLNLSQPTVSHHMKVLTDAGLVTREQRGKWAYYRVDVDALEQIARVVATTRG